MKVYLDPSLPHSYLECRVREDRDLYSRPHMTHRNLSSLAETPSIIGLAVSIHGGFLHMGYPPLSLTGESKFTFIPDELHLVLHSLPSSHSLSLSRASSRSLELSPFFPLQSFILFLLISLCMVVQKKVNDNGYFEAGFVSQQRIMGK